jgi:outer membrane protein assembly factor BamB
MKPATALLLILPFAVNAENWPQFRGPGGKGVSSEPNLPVEWAPDRNIAWKTEIPGRGNSSPVIWGDRIFLTTSLEGDAIPGAQAPRHIQEGTEFKHPDALGGDRKHTLQVLAMDAKSGKILWNRTAYEGRVYDDRHKANTYATPTPVTDGKRVYVWFESQGLYAYSFDGKLVWKTSLGNIGTVGMGPGTSPVLADGVLVLQCDQEEGEGSFIAGVSTSDGKLVWKVTREDPVTWATPVVMQGGNGRPIVVASGMKNVIAYEPKTGKEVWRAKGVEGNAVPSPVSGLGMVFPSAGYPEKRVYGLKADGTQVWKYEKGAAYVPSPVLYGEYLYLVTDRGLITCLEARTGRLVYEGKRVPKPAMFKASPAVWGGKLFWTSEEGDTFVIAAGPEFAVVGTNPVDEAVSASFSISGGRVYLRGSKHLFAIGR